MDGDIELRRRIFAFFAAHERAPQPAEVAATAEEFLQLQERHALVVDDHGNIVIANPFSGVPTDYVVESGRRRWYANCCWDALGVLAALGADGATRTHCSDCGQALELNIRDGELAPTSYVAHFLVPARRWYDNLVFT